MKVGLVLLSLVGAWCASPSTAGAQTTLSPAPFEEHAPAVGANAFSCVDPSDALARRWFQDERRRSTLGRRSIVPAKTPQTRHSSCPQP